MMGCYFVLDYSCQWRECCFCCHVFGRLSVAQQSSICVCSLSFPLLDMETTCATYAPVYIATGHGFYGTPFVGASCS